MKPHPRLFAVLALVLCAAAYVFDGTSAAIVAYLSATLLAHNLYSRPVHLLGTWGAVAIGGGALLNLYGANKQETANNKARDQNQRNFDQQQLQNWNDYLLERGINPSGNTTVGSFGTGGPVNTRLPIWASVSTGARRLVPIGTKSGTPTLVVQNPS